MRLHATLTYSIACLAMTGCSSGNPGEPAGAAGSALLATLDGTSGGISPVPKPANPYTLFETLQVRPLALSVDGRLLFAANTPDNRLEVFAVGDHGLESIASVVVGLEPVAVAARPNGEVWVVNHLSDSISIVDASHPTHPRVTRTLLVGDEPRDIVFAGRDHDLAFVTTAHRGQNSPDDPDLFASGVGRADVWVFDANALGQAPGGTRLTKLTFFADTPRALAASPDGSRVYAAAFFSGNQTTSVADGNVGTVYGNTMPGPGTITVGGQVVPQPQTGLIVKWRQGGPDGQYHWLDAYGAVFDPFVTIQLPDDDVFAIDATQSPPAPAAVGPFAHVGTTLFNMAVNPKNGKVYVTNTDAHNDVRFEGHTPGFTSVDGNEVDSRITVIDPVAGSVDAVNLNPHLDHTAGIGDKSLSRAFPEDVVVTRDGARLVAVAQGSSKIVVYDTSDLEAGRAPATTSTQVAVSGGGPTGVVVDERGRHAFVLTRFDDGISVVDLDRRAEVSHVAMFNPEPPSVTQGRRFLYDATNTSALGDQACASCHIGGDFDGLAWDLGNPGNIPLPITTTYANATDVFTADATTVGAIFGDVTGIFAFNMPVKGPMTTQSLRGLDNHGSMHWRGDRNGAIQQTGLPFLDGAGNPVVSAQPNSGIFDEFNAFVSFNVAFPGLVGATAELSDSDMAKFADFDLQITYPPNPIRNLDNTLTAEQAAGQAFYFNAQDGAELPSDRIHDCNGCHVLNRDGNRGQSPHPGFFGTDGRLSFEGESQIFKVPHLRNAYQKLGMYGAPIAVGHSVASIIPQLNPPVQAVRGFGYNHDGIEGTIEDFLSAIVFIQTTTPLTLQGLNLPPNPDGIPFFADPANPLDSSNGLSQQGLALRRALASFILAFDTNLFPIVGQQLTLTSDTIAANAARLALLEAQADAGACDLVARGHVFGRDGGFVYASGAYVPDTSRRAHLSTADLEALVQADPDLALTFTAVPPGSGWRIGVDRDSDGFADGDEIQAGSDPANPLSTP